MNKGIRNYLKRKYYIRRLKRNSYYLYSNKLKRLATWKELYDNRECTQLMTCSTFCSCWMCSKIFKYKRRDTKKETLRILKESDNILI